VLEQEAASDFHLQQQRNLKERAAQTIPEPEAGNSR